MGSGTNQKAEDFEERKNWVLVCGETYSFQIIAFYKVFHPPFYPLMEVCS